ncbi:hypothetical protein BT63DRAFT_158395 [Microthyrium microscopicum]|uniref:Uncharacterized protein n=1 Tax=Microthyrium microscopicum TaxID=703497 RepID=A0A6A6URE7_9PEZI|nr:hypothetical protein BT63DRAFT_158395 [Microthyrium microscopicum]
MIFVLGLKLSGHGEMASNWEKMNTKRGERRKGKQRKRREVKRLARIGEWKIKRGVVLMNRKHDAGSYAQLLQVAMLTVLFGRNVGLWGLAKCLPGWGSDCLARVLDREASGSCRPGREVSATHGNSNHLLATAFKQFDGPLLPISNTNNDLPALWPCVDCSARTLIAKKK